MRNKLGSFSYHTVIDGCITFARYLDLNIIAKYFPDNNKTRLVFTPSRINNTLMTFE